MTDGDDGSVVLVEISPDLIRRGCLLLTFVGLDDALVLDSEYSLSFASWFALMLFLRGLDFDGIVNLFYLLVTLWDDANVQFM